MDRASFLQLVSGTRWPEDSDGEALAAVTVRYPYFQTARVLYAQSLRAADSMLFGEALKVAAAHAGNRKVLHERIHAGRPARISPAHPVQTEPGPPEAAVAPELPPSVPAPPKAPKIPPRKPAPPAPPPARHSFTDWLHVVGNKPAGPSPGISAKPKKARPAADPRELIGKFLRQEPRITPRAEFFSPENMAKKSLAEHDEFLTETLARIYAGQGHIAKAVRICERLGLKYPEKSSYFAALAEKFRAQEEQ